MNENQNEQQFSQQLLVMQMLNGAMIASVGILAFVGNMIPGGNPENSPISSMLFLPIAAVVGVLSFVVPKMMLKNGAKLNGKHFEAAFFVSYVLSLALSESVGIFGLVAKIHTGDTTVFWSLLATSAVLVAIRFPTRERVLGMIAAARAGN